MSEFLFVGLGNIGAEYANTRHNIGFDIMNAFVLKHGGNFNVDRLAYAAEVKFKGRQIVCICPTTFMNLSGRAYSVSDCKGIKSRLAVNWTICTLVRLLEGRK